MNLRRLLPLVVCALVVAGTATAGATYLEKLGAVWGRDMTVGQFLRAVDPDSLASTTARMRAAKVTWVGPGDAMVTARYAGPLAASTSAREAGVRLLAGMPDIYVDCDNNGVWFPVEEPYVVRYAALTTVTSPWHYQVPYMWLKARLLFNGMTLHQKTVSKSNVWRVTAASSCELRGAGDYCCVSYHYVEFPAGYDPATYYEVKISPIESW